jgi:RNA polymerase sigma-70 factor, ECF subfamily
LKEMRAGEQKARDKLIEAAYGELRRIANAHMQNERRDHTLAPTALVHEAYAKLFSGEDLQFADRSHFFAVMSRVMRQILVDHARSRGRQKRGGPEAQVTLTLDDVGPILGGEGRTLSILDLDRAIDALSQEDEPLAQTIEMHYFAGMTAEEVAEATGRSVHIVRHNIRLAKAWLRRALDSMRPESQQGG